MAKELFGSFVSSHGRNYANIGKACIRHGLTVRLGDSPDIIIVSGEVSKLFKEYMKKCQPDFTLVMEG